jgi:hypothetical protein
MEKQLTGVRVQLSADEQQYQADCSIFLESYGPPARWRGHVWALIPAKVLRKGAKGTITLPQGSSGEIVIQRAGVRGSYDFQGEGLPPNF